MSSIIKVDTIQNAAGGTPTAGDLGLNITGSVIQVTQAFSGSRFTGGSGNTWHETNCTHSITPILNNSKFMCQFHQNFRFYANGGTIFRGGIRLKRRIAGGAWTILTNSTGHRETFQTRTPSSTLQELGNVFSGSFLDEPVHNGSLVEYILEANMTVDSGSAANSVISWEGDRGNFMNILEIAG